MTVTQTTVCDGCNEEITDEQSRRDITAYGVFGHLNFHGRRCVRKWVDVAPADDEIQEVLQKLLRTPRPPSEALLVVKLVATIREALDLPALDNDPDPGPTEETVRAQADAAHAFSRLAPFPGEGRS